MTDASVSRRASAAQGGLLLYRHFEALAVRQPDAPAIVYGGWRLSYRDVNGAANRLAHRLLALGAGANVPVALCLHRGPDLLVAMLAVMKAGAAYLPLDPDWPRARLQAMHAAAQPPLLVTRATLRDVVPGHDSAGVVDLDRDRPLIDAGSAANPELAISPESWCYLLFTSGSTGVPKGVPVSHANLLELFPPLVARLDLGAGDVWSWLHSPAFGFSIWEIWGALRHGGCLVVVPEHVRQDPIALGELLVEEGVTVLSQTPSGYRRLAAITDFHRCVDRSPLRWLALSGEALRRDDIAAWTDRQHAARLISTYALTETAGQVTLRIYDPDDATEAGGRNLGAPLPGRHVLVLDPQGCAVPVGEAGELWVGGDCVVNGYLAAEQDAGRFGVRTVPGAGPVHGYCTGDRGRQLPDGSLEYLGRLDAQLKYRGYRIEPGEIETSLREHPGVQDAAIAVRPDASGNQRLTAWVVARTTAGAPPIASGTDLEFWPSLGAYGVYDQWLYSLMNAEPVRLAAYRAALAAAVRGQVVLDIGTGEDAVLARLCAEAGAKHVYAVEVLESAAARAAALVRNLGLEQRITVLHGDIRTLALPQAITVCTQGIIGNIGSADGIVGVWNAARRHFAPGCRAVPERCVTRIAALELPAGSREQPRFGPLAADYARRLFDQAGQDVDLRLCVRNVQPSALLTAPADFEDLDFSAPLPATLAGSAELLVERDGYFDGCLLWTVVTAGPGQIVDYLAEQQAWLPVYLPLADEPLAVRRGSVLKLDWERHHDSDPDFPDYTVTVRLPGPDGWLERRHTTRHRETTSGGTALHRRLLGGMSRAGDPLSVTTLRHWLGSRVPEHLVPQSWMFVPELPLGPGGKLDRAALPTPAATRPRLDGPPLPPRTAAERALAGIWTRVMGLEGIGVADDFFELGGDSITAVQLTTAIQRWLDAALPLAALFQAPTIKGLADYVAEHHGTALSAALGREAPPAAAPAAAVPGEPVPLCFPQQSLWFLHSLHGTDTSGSEQFVLRLSGELDEEALQSAWMSLLERHPVLKSSFVARDDSVWQCPGSGAMAPLRRLDLAGDSARLEALAEAELARPFDLAAGGLLRAVLCRLDGTEHRLVVTAHHIVADGLSVPVLGRDLAAFYAADCLGEPAGLPPASDYLQLGSDPRWQRGSDAREQLDWWCTQLADLPPDPLDALVRPPAGPRVSRRQGFSFSAAQTDGLRALARATGTTPFMVLLAVFRSLLVRLTGQSDVLIGTPMTLRDTPELRDMVGCLVNPVVLRAPVDAAASFRDHLLRERDAVLAALEFGRVPFAQVVEALAPTRVPGRHPLFQVLFSFETVPVALPPVAGLQFDVASLPVTRASYFDLECACREGGEGEPLTGYFAWATTALEEAVARQLPDWMASLVDDILAQPAAPVGRLSLLPADGRAMLLHGWNATDADFPPGTLADYFLAQMVRTPEAPALRMAGRELSYAQLAARSAVLAGQLRGRGIGPGSVVGLALGRTPAAVLALLAILRAGGTVLPLDPAYPLARLKFMCRDAGASLLLAGSTRLAASLRTGTVPVVVLDPDGEVDEVVPDEVIGDAFPPSTDWCVPVPASSPAFILYTSGSTGEPKGAATTHASAVNRCHWMWRQFGFGPDEVFALRTTLNFIDAWWEIFGALGHGIPLEIAPDEVAGDALALPAWLAARKITQLVLVPSLLEAVLDSLPAPSAPGPGPLPDLRWCISSGEPLSPALVHRSRALLPQLRLINTYGTSEVWDATAFDTTRLAPNACRVPIGRPVANARVYVLDADGAPVPPGIPGELAIGGIGIGPGYTGQPALTAERYVPDRLSGRPGRLYRSGDRARFLPDGTLECLGRLDAQFQLRGFRVEPAEIETALRAHPAVQDAVVAIAGEGAGVRLVAGVVLMPDSGDDSPAPDWLNAPGPRLTRYLRDLLPPHLIPGSWQVLSGLPRTPSGKLDRRSFALSVTDTPAEYSPDTCGPAFTPAESRLAAVWQAVLGAPPLRRDDNFFACGGHSLLAVRFLNRIRTGYGRTLALRSLFESPTFGELASLLAAAEGDGSPSAMPVLPRSPGIPLPLSFGQERLWFLSELEADNPAYNVAWTIRCTGALDEPALRQALNQLAARHEPLRTRFVAPAGRPAQVIDPPMAVQLARLDLPGPDPEPAEVDAVLVRYARGPFDLARGPLWRAALIRVAPRQHILCLAMAHLITDATSNQLLFQELATLYAAARAGAAATLAPPALQYADAAAWQRATGNAGFEADLAWWRARLAGLPPVLELPADRPRPAEQSLAGAIHHMAVPAALAQALDALSRDAGTTLFMTLLAGFKALLHRWSGATDLVVGTPVEGRLRPEVEAMIGLFINTVVLRTDLSDDPAFSELLTRVRATTVDAQAHQGLPFEKLVEVLAPERSLSRSPVFQVMFNFLRVTARSRQVGELEFRLDRLVDLGVSPFDLTLTAARDDDTGELALSFEYPTEMFDAATIRSLADSYLVLLAGAARRPATPLSRLPLLEEPRPEETDRLGDDVPLVTAAIAAHAARSPDAPALSLAGTALTYGELDRRSSQLARYLRRSGVGSGQRVGICLPRGPEYIVAVLGVLKAGAAYVPLDPDYPALRLAWMASDAGLVRLIVAPGTRQLTGAMDVPLVDVAAEAAAIRCESAVAPAELTGREQPAYVLYTSGSTGQPKGVVVTHGNLASTLAGWQEAWDLAPGETHLQMASAAFDVFTGDWVRALGTGGCLEFCPREVLLDPPALLDLLDRARIQVAEFVPAVMRLLLGEMLRTNRHLPAMRLLIVGSDQWYAPEYRALRARCAPGTRLINSYGVAEATIDSTWFEAATGELPGNGPVPIGRAFPHSRIMLLDARGEPVPCGMPGELCIAGPGVSQGYLHQPELTADRFRGAGPQRYYRSGDRARWNGAGQLVLLGRADNQLKLRGWRIEAGEIEGRLAALPAVAAAVVGLAPAGDPEAQLVAWIVLQELAGSSPEDDGTVVAGLRAALRRELPAPLVPAIFIRLPALPLTPNGKVDRAALSLTSGLPMVPAAADSPPLTPGEEIVGELFRTTLELQPGFRPVGRLDDFFALGGHSLLATRLIARIRDTFQVGLPLRVLFETPTVAGIAAAVGTLRGTTAALTAPRRGATTTGDLRPLSPMQQRLWFLERLQPATSTWHLHWIVRMRGAPDLPALQRAWNGLVARHASLRTTFVEVDGVAAQRVAPPSPMPVGRHTPAELRQLLETPFDLCAGPLVRLSLCDEEGGTCTLVLVVHHLVADGWSLGILNRELAALYNDATLTLPPLPLEYGDYALWHADLVATDVFAGQLAWWRERLRGAPPVLLPRADAAERADDAGGAWLTRCLDPATLGALRGLALAEGATLFMVVLAAFSALLGRLARLDDVVVGTPVAGRSHTGLEGLIGFFVNTLALRTDLKGDPGFRELLARVRADTLAAFDHALVPFEQVVEAVQPPRSLSHSPLVQVLLVLHNQPRAPLALEGLEILPAVATDAASPALPLKFALSLHLAEEADGLQMAFGWRPGLVGTASMVRVADDWQRLLTAIVAAPDAPLSALLGERLPGAACAGPAGCGPLAGSPRRATQPETAVESRLQAIWQELLGQPSVGVTENFFALGGHSLLAMRLIARIADRLDVELPLISLFESPTIRELAARIELPGQDPRVGRPGGIPRLPRQPAGERGSSR